ncbi:MAG: hypothetical protein N2561_00175 [Bacteroidetes bacterium]|nr:hypothetical protein [Bacteroidota bacterium]MDW8138090.1 hypothetical protein [Bacteroidota bacterium]
MRLGAFALGFLLCAHPTAAQDAGAPGAFVRLSWSARALALGDALVAVPWGTVSGPHNPALLPWSPAQSVQAFAALLALDRQLMGVSFQAPLRPSAGVTVGIVQAGVGRIDGRDASGYHTGWLHAAEQRLHFGFGYRMGPRAAFGVGFSFNRSQLHPALSAPTTLGVDVGLLLELHPNWYLGVSVADLLARYSWDTAALYGAEGAASTDRFPLRIRLGSARSWGPWMATGELEVRAYTAERRLNQVEIRGGAPVILQRRQTERLWTSRWSGGLEYAWRDALLLRAGLQGDATGWRPGAGFAVRRLVGELTLEAGYAMGWQEPVGLLGHRLELNVRF